MDSDRLELAAYGGISLVFLVVWGLHAYFLSDMFAGEGVVGLAIMLATAFVGALATMVIAVVAVVAIVGVIVGATILYADLFKGRRNSGQP